MACVSVPTLTTAAEMAAAGGAGGALMGAKSGNSMKDALMGGVLGGLGGEAYGAYDAASAAAANPIDPLAISNGVSPGPAAAVDMNGDNVPLFGGNAAVNGAYDADGNLIQAGVPGGVTSTGAVSGAAPSGTAASGTAGSAAANTANTGGLGTWLGNPKSALQTALLANTGLSAVNSLIPKPKVNIGQNAANVMATNPQFSNPNLPQYTMENTATPYTGNWYTYGQTPQTPLYNAQPTPAAKRGGMIHGYAAGGVVSPANRVNPLTSVMPRLGTALSHVMPTMRGSRFSPHGYAAGGMPMMPQGAPPAMPQGMPPQGMPPQGAMPPQRPAMQKPPVNPLMLAKAHQIGLAIGKHLKSKMGTPPGPVHGAGGGHDDLIPAKLSDGEYVHSADVVAALGDGSSKEGGKKLKQMDAAIRAHKTKNGSKFPPKAHNPLSYLKGTA